MTTTSAATPDRSPLAIWILLGVSLSHGLNDVMQSVLIAIYPILKTRFSLNYTQVGLVGFVFHITASVLQPIIGLKTDKTPFAYSLVFGMGATMCGVLLLAFAPSYALVLLAAGLVGTGSSIFHPDASRIARLASGGRYGFAQSVFQVGGNAGSAIGPLLAALIISPDGQASAAWFAAFALVGMGVLAAVGSWYRAWLAEHRQRQKMVAAEPGSLLQPRILATLSILILLMFSKFVYLSSLNAFYTFYLIEHFQVTVQTAQLCLFILLAATAAGTILGGPIADRIGPRRVILWSILGVLPFTLLLPLAGLTGVIALTIPIGLILASAFSSIVVYAQGLVPGRVGLIGGLFFGLAFGMGGASSAGLGMLADAKGIDFVFWLAAMLPALGVAALWLPEQASTLRK